MEEEKNQQPDEVKNNTPDKEKNQNPNEEKAPPEVYGRIYCITCKINGKKYVGQTIKKVSYRFNEHARANSPLGEAIREYGRKNFEIEVLEECYSFAELNEAEKKWIKEFDCKVPNGYNRTDGGDGLLNPCKDTREKMAEASMGNKNSLGRKHTEDEIERIRNSNLGQKRSAETCAKLSKIKKGVPLSQTTKDNMSKARKGKKFSQEHKDSLSASRKAYWEKIPPEERKQTEEHKAKALAARLATINKRKVAKQNIAAAESMKNFDRVKNYLKKLEAKKKAEQLTLF